MNWELIFANALTLVVVLDPLGNAPVIQGLLEKVDPERRQRILLRELVFILILLLLVFFIGSSVLGALGISQSSLNLSGGIMLFMIAIGLIFPSVNVMGTGRRIKTNTEPFIVPLVVPLIVGPAAISIIMMHSSMCTTSEQIIGSVISLVIAWFLQSIIILCSGYLLRKLGDKAVLSITRLMGMLLVLIAVQMILNGITNYISSLPQQMEAAHHPAISQPLLPAAPQAAPGTPAAPAAGPADLVP